MKRTVTSICAALILGSSMLSAQNMNLWITDEGSGVSFNTGVPFYYPAPVTYYDGPIIVNGHHHHHGHKYKSRSKKMRKDLKKMRKARKKYYKAQRDYYRHAYGRHGYRHHHHDDDDDD